MENKAKLADTSSRSARESGRAAETLLACPFCGGDAVIEEIQEIFGVRKSAGCKTESCMGYQSTVTFSTYREAAKAWNTRAGKPLISSPDAPPAAGERALARNEKVQI